MMLLRRALVLAVAATALAACGGSDEPAPDPTVETPAGFEVPEGVELSPPGADLKVGQEGTFVYDLGSGAASAVTATIDKITKGSVKDFTFFTLDAESKKSTPYYVTATITNRGPAGLGSTAPPFVVHDDQDSIAPPNALTGSFKPCATRSLPKSLLPGKSAKVCMVFLLPAGSTLVSIDSQAKELGDALHWKP